MSRELRVRVRGPAEAPGAEAGRLVHPGDPADRDLRCRRRPGDRQLPGRARLARHRLARRAVATACLGAAGAHQVYGRLGELVEPLRDDLVRRVVGRRTADRRRRVGGPAEPAGGDRPGHLRRAGPGDPELRASRCSAYWPGCCRWRHWSRRSSYRRSCWDSSLRLRCWGSRRSGCGLRCRPTRSWRRRPGWRSAGCATSRRPARRSSPRGSSAEPIEAAGGCRTLAGPGRRAAHVVLRTRRLGCRC